MSAGVVGRLSGLEAAERDGNAVVQAETAAPAASCCNIVRRVKVHNEIIVFVPA